MTAATRHFRTPQQLRAPTLGLGYDGGAQRQSAANRKNYVERSLAPQELQRELLERIYRFMMQLRFVIAPLPLVLGSVVVISGPSLMASSDARHDDPGDDWPEHH